MERMLKRLVDSFQKGPIAFDTGEENGIGEVVPVRQGHGVLAVEGARRVEIPEELAGLVDTRRDSQTCKVFDWVASASSLSSREKTNYSAFRRKRFRATLRESTRRPP